MASLTRLSLSQSDLQTTRIKRKQPPILELTLAERYPPPDPTDPFAPLWVLRSRTSSAQLMQPPIMAGLPPISRRQSAFNMIPPMYTAHLVDEPRDVVSDSERTYSRRSIRQSGERQRSHSLAILSNAGSLTYEFPSVHSGREQTTSPTGFGDIDGCNTDTEWQPRNVRRPRTSQSASDASISHSHSQNKLSRFLGPKKTSTSSSRPTTSPRFRKVSISGPTLISQPPIMNTFSLTMQTSAVDPQINSADILSPRETPSRNGTSSPPLRATASRSQSPIILGDTRYQLPTIESKWRTNNAKMSRVSLTPSPPPTTTSHSAYLKISYPTLSDQYSQTIDDNEFISPRPAPRPPQSTAPSQILPFTRPRRASRNHSKSKAKPLPTIPAVAQSEWALPMRDQLARAARLPVIAESGVRVTFGSLFESQRTIVIFIRHFWCPMCQDYMSSVQSFVRSDILRSPSTGGPVSDEGHSLSAKFVVISNGSHAMISKYRQIFQMPFEMYTDPSLAVYTTLGMGRDGIRPGEYHPTCSLKGESLSGYTSDMDFGDKQQRGRTLANRRGGYVKHGLMGGIVMVVVRAIKVGMPVWEKGGDIAQLGGEFVLGPGLTCSFAHRMQSTKGHAPIQDVVKAANIEATASELIDHKNSMSSSKARHSSLPLHSRRPTNASICYPGTSAEAGDQGACTSTTSHDATITETGTVKGRKHVDSDPEEWTYERERQLRRLRAKKSLRRGFLGGGSISSLEQAPRTTPDAASVVATCSDLERSEESTMQQTTDSEEHTLNEPLDELHISSSDKLQERLENEAELQNQQSE